MRHAIGKVAVHGGRETPNIFAMSVAVMPFSRSARAFAASASSTLRGRPPLRPLAAAAASPTGPGGGSCSTNAQSAACSVSEDHVRLFRSGDATRMFVSTRITATRLIVLSGSGVVNMHAPPWDADLTACVISSG